MDLRPVQRCAPCTDAARGAWGHPEHTAGDCARASKLSGIGRSESTEVNAAQDNAVVVPSHHGEVAAMIAVEGHLILAPVPCPRGNVRLLCPHLALALVDHGRNGCRPGTHIGICRLQICGDEVIRQPECRSRIKKIGREAVIAIPRRTKLPAHRAAGPSRGIVA